MALELAFSLSRTGRPTCATGSLSLHSSYDPQREAERFVDAALKGRSPSGFILLGPCLDYVSPILKARFPLAPVYRANYATGFETADQGRADLDCPVGQDLESFLCAALDEATATGLAVLEWPPAAKAFPEESARATEAVRRALARLAASAATLKISGRRWISNATRSFLLAGRIGSLVPGEAPVVVAAAGPSLNEALRILAPFRSRFFLCVVSSALAAVRASGLEPDLVVATDGGTWSRWHLEPLAAVPAPLAAPLTALPSAGLLAACPLVLLEQGNFPETELARLLGGGIRLPSHGTVSGSALRLAACATTGPIVAAGLDLASRDILSHARPHGFDAHLAAGEGRLAPLLTKLWARESEAAPIEASVAPWRLSRSLEVYAEALAQDAADPALKGRLFRLLPSPVDLGGFEELMPGQAGAFFRESPWRMPRVEVGPAIQADREALLSVHLAAWREGAISAAEALARGEDLGGPGWARVREMLMAVDFVDWAAARRALASGRDPGPSAKAFSSAALDYLGQLERTLLR